MSVPCDSCVFYVYDDDMEAYLCQIDLDEDEIGRFMNGSVSECPYYRHDDEYGVVRKQN